MRAGTLSERITIQRQPDERDAWGERTQWADIGTYSASVTPTDGSEGKASEGIASRTSYTIKLRHNASTAAIRPTDRITWQGQIIDITGIIPDERRTEILIKGVAHGS